MDGSGAEFVAMRVPVLAAKHRSRGPSLPLSSMKQCSTAALPVDVDVSTTLVNPKKSARTSVRFEAKCQQALAPRLA